MRGFNADKCRVVVFSLAMMLSTPYLMGAEDAYLREIEGEVKRQATTLTLEPPQLATPKKPVEEVDVTGDTLPTGLDTEAFAQTLRKTLPGTYSLYDRLKPPAKQQVYTAYRSDPRLSNISAEVARLLGSKP